MDYQPIIDLLIQIVKAGLPIGVLFLVVERAVNLFLSFAFPKTFKGGL